MNEPFEHLLLIDTHTETPVYVQIIDQVRRAVTEGRMVPGSPLPPIRQLARDLGVNPNTVAKSYLLLEREGTVRTARRRGTFVADGAPATAAEALDRRLRAAVDRMLEEAVQMGLDGRDLLAALDRRLAPPDHEPPATLDTPTPGDREP